MNNQTLRIGTVGSSAVMDVMQDAIRHTYGTECSVVYSRTEERAKEYAAKNSVAAWCCDYDEFVQRKDIDVVYIASPNILHTQQALAALNAGKHVIIEKPMALTRAEVDLLHKAALDHDVFILEAITTLFVPNYLACRELMHSLGEIQEVNIRYGQYSSKMDDYKKGIISNSLNPDMQGGALNDMGIYCIHMAVDLFGAPESVSYKPIYGPNGADLEGDLILTYPDLTCYLKASKQRDIGSGSLIRGSRGFFGSDGPLHNFVSCHACLGEENFQISLQGKENRMLYELKRFRDAINQKDRAFFRRMYDQSRTATGILEDAHAAS